MVVGADQGLPCLAPFPWDHPYAGYSAPGVAATACAPPPHVQPACPSSEQQQQQQCEQGAAAAGALQLRPQGAGHALQAVQAEAEARSAEARVLELWPAFARVRSGAAVLQPGDAVYVPAGSFVQLESLGASSGAVGSASGSGGSGASGTVPGATQHAGGGAGAEGAAGAAGAVAAGGECCAPDVGRPPLPGSALLVCSLWAASPALAPRSVGALELQVARVAERWAKQCVGACVLRTCWLARAGGLGQCCVSGGCVCGRGCWGATAALRLSLGQRCCAEVPLMRPAAACARAWCRQRVPRA